MLALRGSRDPARVALESTLQENRIARYRIMWIQGLRSHEIRGQTIFSQRPQTHGTLWALVSTRPGKYYSLWPYV